MVESSRRKICVVVNSRANYGRIKAVMHEIQRRPTLELQILVGASALLSRFGDLVEIMRADGLEPTETVHTIIEGENPTTMAKSTGLAIIELSSMFGNIKPDIVVTVADRFETLATAVAASYMNIGLAHTQGGEVTGSIDESVRHAVTKLAHLHFPASKQAAEFVKRMGEPEDTVFMTGCPALDVVAGLDLSWPSDLLSLESGVGAELDPEAPYLLVLQHPVTTEFGDGERQITETIEAVSRIGMQAVWLWPNIDAGSDDVAKGLRKYREQNTPNWLRLFKNFPPEEYARLLRYASCVVGNTSSSLREGAFLGSPVVNIGSRQSGREHAENVIHAGYNRDDIEKAIRAQLSHGRYSPDYIFGDGNAAPKIVDVLEKAKINVQKRLSYVQDT
ncbi:UDP-N-acetylglucosamine 2-epimerase [Thalassospira alkalitolerans]|uniref:UDP-N-acetylglucosamine 2-epimerase n=1 Tax=Thalassospira alkalitolerans TaxID=1293890 RepID=UPI003AA89144